jgi:predicted TIM-barrel enzyme
MAERKAHVVVAYLCATTSGSMGITAAIILEEALYQGPSAMRSSYQGKSRSFALRHGVSIPHAQRCTTLKGFYEATSMERVRT